MPRTRWRTVVCAILMLGTLPGIFWWFGDKRAAVTTAVPLQQSADRADVASDEAAKSALAQFAAGAAANKALAALPLPPLDAALDDVVAELLPRAEAGEHRAACRLGFELLRCETILRQGDSLLGKLGDQERRGERRGNVEFANRIAEQQLALLAARDNCKVIAPELAGRGGELLYAAARAGHRESMLRFIQGDGLAYLSAAGSEATAASFMGHPHFETWYREAPAMAERLLASGDTAALFYLSLGLGGDTYDLFSARIPDDLVRSAALRTVMATINGRPPPAFADLSGAQLTQVRQMATDLLTGPFANAQMDRELLNRLWSPGDSLSPDLVARCD